jgi:glycosyltransferase involved in cell wall biosynthesis
LNSTNNPIRILIISRDIEIGGMQKAAITLAQNLVNAGFAVDYFCLFKRRDPEEFKDIDSRIQLFQPKYYRESTPKWFYILYNYLRLKRISKVKKYDRYVSFGEHFNGFNILALWKNRSRMFVLDRMNPQMNCGFPTENLRRNLYKFTKGLIVQTNFAKDVLFSKTKHPNIRVIRNFLSLNDDVIKELQTERQNNSLKICPLPQLLYLGRLSPEKGVSTLIDSTLKLAKDGYDFELNVVGEGVLINELKRKSVVVSNDKNDTYDTQTLGRIKFHGAVSDPINFYKSNHIFILPSLSEGFPNALIEAMSAGMACIVSDRLKDKLTFLVENENVIFFECENHLDLSIKISRVFSQVDLWDKLSKNAMELSTWFQSESILSEYLEMLDLTNSCKRK